MARNQYNTKSREIIKEEIINFPNGFTIKELKDTLDSKNYKIGLTTIYRTIELLKEEGIVKQYFDSNNTASYKYTNDCISDNHFYLKCVKCETIYHVDCSCMSDLYYHILKTHKFAIQTKNIILPGLCSKCKNFINL